MRIAISAVASMALSLLVIPSISQAQIVTCMDPGGFPACNGSCPEGQACVDAGTDCACVNKSKACESAAGPACDGNCPPDHACQPFSTGCQCVLVPTLSQWGIIFMSLAMLSGVLVMRRRSGAQSKG